MIFGSGRGVVDGHADFLAEPHPGFHVKYLLEQVPLDRLKPMSARADLSLSGGILSSHGRLEYAPKHKEARIDDVTVRPGSRMPIVRPFESVATHDEL